MELTLANTASGAEAWRGPRRYASKAAMATTTSRTSATRANGPVPPEPLEDVVPAAPGPPGGRFSSPRISVLSELSPDDKDGGSEATGEIGRASCRERV